MFLRGTNCAPMGLQCSHDPYQQRMNCIPGTGTDDCDGTPGACADIGATAVEQRYGCCDGNTAYWCDDAGGAWAMRSENCSGLGEFCEYVSTYGGMYCGM